MNRYDWEPPLKRLDHLCFQAWIYKYQRAAGSQTSGSGRIVGLVKEHQTVETLKNKSEHLNWILTTDYLYDIKIIHTLHQCLFLIFVNTNRHITVTLFNNNINME